MKNKIKKVVAAVLLGTLLLGNTLAVQAADARVGVHTHEFQETFSRTIRSVHTTHEYVTGNIYDINGKLIGHTYGTCDVTTYLNEYIYKCKYCSATTGTSTTRTEVVHSVNH